MNYFNTVPLPTPAGPDKTINKPLVINTSPFLNTLLQNKPFCNLFHKKPPIVFILNEEPIPDRISLPF